MDSNDHTMENNKVMSAPLFSPSASSSTIMSLPPGFRFRPTDEELIVHYLQQKVNSRPLPAFLIAEINLYMYNPWVLPNKALFGEDEWYFFSPIYRKYPNGERPNRAAGSGYWKATGTDRSIVLSDGSDQIIGVKKALVFYKGRPPKGTKTDWTMSEYRITDTSSSSSNAKSSVFKKSMRLDDWVLCRVRRRGNLNQLMGGEDHNYPSIVTPKAREENYYYPYTSQQASNMSDYLSMQHLFRDSQVMSSLLIGEYQNRSPNQTPNSEEAPFSTIPKNVSSIINNYIDKNHNNNSGARYDFQGFNHVNATGWMGRYVPEEDTNSPNIPVPVWEKNNGVESIILEDHTYQDNHLWDNETESDDIVIDQQYQTMYDSHGNMSSYDSTGFLLNF